MNEDQKGKKPVTDEDRVRELLENLSFDETETHHTVYMDDGTDEDYTDIDVEEVTSPTVSDKEKTSASSEIFEWLESICISVVFVILLFTFAFRIVEVDGSSMVDTLHDKDRIVLSTFLYEPKALDVVVFMPEIAGRENKPFVKRIIATEGQSVTVNAEEHSVYVNGIRLNEDYIYEALIKQGNQQYPVTVPLGHVFVMGDNRNDSLDSRFAEVGTIDKRLIIGRVLFRVYPFDSIGSVK